jgi:peptidoglycan-associated lipoprotein
MQYTMKKHVYLLAPLMGLFSCTAHHMATADKAYERMAYAQASAGYEKVLQRNSDRHAALRAADSHRRTSQHKEAAHWYAAAAGMGPLEAEHALNYARVLISNGKHAEALAQVEQVLVMQPEDDVAGALRRAIVERAAYYQDSSLYSVRVVELPGLVAAFSATPYGDGIVLAGERLATKRDANPWNGHAFLDLYRTSRSSTGEWSSPTLLKGAVNGRFHEGPAVFSNDGGTMYFTRSDYYKFRLNKDGNSVSHLRLFRAELDEAGNWGGIHQFAHNSNDHSTGHAALSVDGKTLYFISDRPGGEGGTDLYSCTRTPEGWSKPENLGATVNSSQNEMFPTMHGDTLYFSSNGLGGLGGLDLFKTWQEDGSWVEPVNINHPLNSVHDDFSLQFMQDGRSGYLSSNRSGSDRIHFFEVNEPVLTLRGRCIQGPGGAPLPGVAVALFDAQRREHARTTTSGTGEFSFTLLPGQDYQVQATLGGYFTNSADRSTLGQRISRDYDLTFSMTPVELDRPMVVDDIYYELDRWDITAEAAVELKKLARLFNENPSLHFEISSHTDSRASATYNLVLSEARAKSAVDFLVRIGVDPQRVTARGYGEARLVNHCRDGVECSEEEHQRNRRTEFTVLRSPVAVE